MYGWKYNALISVFSCIPLILYIIYTDLDLPTFLLDLSCLHLTQPQPSLLASLYTTFSLHAELRVEDFCTVHSNALYLKWNSSTEPSHIFPLLSPLLWTSSYIFSYTFQDCESQKEVLLPLPLAKSQLSCGFLKLFWKCFPHFSLPILLKLSFFFS